MSAPAVSPTLDRLLAGVVADAPALPVTGLALDSRQVRPGDVFVAVSGTREHGLRHLPQALARGAGAVLWEPAAQVSAPQASVPCIAVERLSAWVGELAARFYGRPSEHLYVAGITGTDGKTSTAHLLAQAFERLGRPCAYIGTLGLGRLDQLDAATHTTPDPIALQRVLAGFVDSGVQACAMEVSSHAHDQHRVGGVHFDAAVLTNISRDHLDYHGSVERYAAAKRRLFEARGAACRLILNRDDAFGLQWAQELHAADPSAPLCVYGIEGEVPTQGDYLIARDLALHEQGLSFTLCSAAGSARLNSALLGRFNVYNLLAAAAVLLASGVPLDHAVGALSASRTVPGRIEGFRGAASDVLAVVDYAHTPKALEQVLLALRPHTRGLLWCVFGCGGDRDAGKRPLMGAVAARLADRVVVTDDNPRSESAPSIARDILQGIAPEHQADVVVEHDRARAIAQALDAAKAGDIVLVAGKGHETTQTYADQVRPFSDRAFVAAHLGAVA